MSSISVYSAYLLEARGQDNMGNDIPMARLELTPGLEGQVRSLTRVPSCVTI